MLYSLTPMGYQIHSLWRGLACFSTARLRCGFCGYVNQEKLKNRSIASSRRGRCILLRSSYSTVTGDVTASPSNGITSSERVHPAREVTLFDTIGQQGEEVKAHSSSGRIMLIDGTSVIYRAYYKLLARLHHGHLSHADGNVDWVLTIFAALSLVPDVEADDVIGTLVVRSVDEGLKVRVVSPAKDFFPILSPSLCFLRIAPRGIQMVSYGMEDFAEKYGPLKPSQFVDVIALIGDKCDNIPGTLENVLEHVEQVDEQRIRKALIDHAENAILSKNWRYYVLIFSSYMVPFSKSDLVSEKPKDNVEKFTSLLTVISAYAEGFSADPLIRRILHLWKKIERK